MDDIKINPDFIGLFYNELIDIENKTHKELDKNSMIKKYKKIKINEKEIKILKEIINLLCDKNK